MKVEDRTQVEAIKNMPVLQDSKQLKSFLGMNCYNSLEPKMRQMKGPLHDLDKAEKY